jgi:hypothetical protein
MRVASPEEGRQRIPHLGLGPAEIPPRDAARFGEEKAGYGRGTLLLAGGWDGGRNLNAARARASSERFRDSEPVLVWS